MRKAFTTGLLTFTIVLVLGNAKAYGQNLEKYQTLYIYNFTKYIRWPNASQQLTIGVLGSGAVYKELEKMVNTKGAEKLKLVKLSSLDNLDHCNIIFLTKGEEKNLHPVLEKTKGKSILIISENEDSVKKGAGISFFLKDGKLRFSINKGAIEERNMKISSNLLSLAKVI